MNHRIRLPRPSAARLAGDDYQHLFTWLHALKLLGELDGITRIRFEVGDAGNVDDLVVERRDAPTLYHQVKFVQAQAEPLTHTWFTKVPKGARQTPLQRFQGSFELLTHEGERPEMVLHTNRWPAAGDPILRHVDGRTHKLVPRLAVEKPSSASGKTRGTWAEHLRVDERALLDLLAHLEIRAGRSSYEEMREHCLLAMAAVGLRMEPEALDLGVAEIRRLIEEGVSELDADSIREIVSARKLGAETRRATFLIQALDRDSWPEAATVALDWVDLFAGDEPAARRQLVDPAGWEGQLRPELREAVASIKRLRYRDVLLSGTFRLSTGFLAGSELSDVAGFRVAVRTREGEWTSSGEQTPVEIDARVVEVGQGDDVAFGVSVAVDLTDDVLAYLSRAAVPAGRFVNLMPKKGIGRSAISSPAEARGMAQALLDAMRAAGGKDETVLHLFQAGPLGLAILLGHLWNRMPRTQLYDDLGPGRGYAPTFVIG